MPLSTPHRLPLFLAHGSGSAVTVRQRIMDFARHFLSVVQRRRSTCGPLVGGATAGHSRAHVCSTASSTARADDSSAAVEAHSATAEQSQRTSTGPRYGHSTVCRMQVGWFPLQFPACAAVTISAAQMSPSVTASATIPTRIPNARTADRHQLIRLRCSSIHSSIGVTVVIRRPFVPVFRVYASHYACAPFGTYILESLDKGEGLIYYASHDEQPL